MSSDESKPHQPKRSNNNSSNNIVTGTRGTNSVHVKKETKITKHVYSAKTSTSTSRTSQTIAASSSSATASVPTRTYTPVYQRPKLSVAADASPPTSYLQQSFRKNDTSKAIIPVSSNALRPSSSLSSTYDLSKNGYVLVLHHDKFENNAYNRPGSEKDMAKIRQILQQYRCNELDVNENYTIVQVERKMDQISKKDFSQYSCLIVFIMSHGNVNDTIMAYDGKLYSFRSDVVENCLKNRTLNDKPKLFVVQACRGDAHFAPDTASWISHTKDLVIFQSSFQGAVSFRHEEQGSYFMQAFLRLLHEHSSKDIYEINKILNHEFDMKRIKQTPTYSATLMKDFIFSHLLRRSKCDFCDPT